MKKDLEWLKEKIKEEHEYNRAEHNKGGFEGYAHRGFAFKYVLKLINQLDEPEVLSQKWVEDNSVYASSDGVTEEYVHVDDLQNLLVPKQEEITESFKETVRKLVETSELAMDVRKLTGMTLEEIKEEARNGGFVPKQELPVIPKFVAEFLIGKEDYMLYELFDDEWLYKEHDRVAKWLYDNDELTNKQREIDLVMARDRGYTVGEEQKYRVILEENSYGAMGLGIGREGRLTFTATHDKWCLPKLTEQEIKDYDERYWPFAVKVEELEE